MVNGLYFILHFSILVYHSKSFYTTSHIHPFTHSQTARLTLYNVTGYIMLFSLSHMDGRIGGKVGLSVMSKESQESKPQPSACQRSALSPQLQPSTGPLIVNSRHCCIASF